MLHTLLERHWSRFRLLYRMLFFITLTTGIYLGVHPSPPSAAFRLNLVDSAYHAGGLFACTLLSYIAYPRWRWMGRGFSMFALGIAIEYVQSFHPTRSAELGDIYANTAGVLLGLSVVWLWQRQSTTR